MPGGDGTGPRGQGPMTGRGFGYCGPYGGRGYGRGWYGGGRGRRNRFFRPTGPGGFAPWDEPYTIAGELERLRAERDQLREALGDLNQRLETLEKQDQNS